jgi:hemoglobin-like flavoprotein
MKVLDDLLPILENKKTKIVLYSYDSFLFDFHKEDGIDFIKEIKQTIEQNKTYPVKVAWGKNYHKIQDITEKFND